MNDEQLTADEHAAVRARVLAGAKRIRPVGRHRTAFVATTLAVVLVAGVAGAVAATSALRDSGRDDVAVATPTPTSTPTPSATPTTAPTPTSTPTPTPTTAPHSFGVMAFGGHCGNVLGVDEIEAAAGMRMVLSDWRWESGEISMLGGLDCLWLSPDEYMARTVQVIAYPNSVVPAETRAYARPCEEAWGAWQCARTAVVGETVIAVIARLSSPGGFDHLFDTVSARASAFPAPRPAERTGDWWQLPPCAHLAAALSPSLLGFDSVSVVSDGENDIQPGERADPAYVPVHAGAERRCGFSFSSGGGDTWQGRGVDVMIVPGAGEIALGSASLAEGSQPIDVAGARGAVLVPGNDRYDGSWEKIVLTDGVNALIVGPSDEKDPRELVGVAAAILAHLG